MPGPIDFVLHFDQHLRDLVQAYGPWVYGFLFAFYFCNYFVIVFFNAALVSCALIRFNGGEPTGRGG